MCIAARSLGYDPSEAMRDSTRFWGRCSTITTTDGLTTVSKAFLRCELVKVKSAKRKIRRPVTA